MVLRMLPGTDSTALNIEEVTWGEVKGDIQCINQELFDAVQRMNPSDHLKLIKARYPYGTEIIDRGLLYLPTKNGRTLPITSDLISDQIKKQLMYSPIPLALSLNKSSEVYVKDGERIIPLRLFDKGQLFGLFEIACLLCKISANPIWCVCSGVRSIFMLPKIADKAGYQRLKCKLQLALDPPLSLKDHWNLFAKISQHHDFINDWYSDLLFFTDEWFAKPYNHPDWIPFYSYVLKQNSVAAHKVINETVSNIVWQCFATALGSRNLRPRTYVADVVRHLIFMGIGNLPGFGLDDMSELAAPTQLIKNIFVNEYGLKNHLPTIMYTHFLTLENTSPIYYSLNFPTLVEGIGTQRAFPDVIDDMRAIKSVIDTIYHASDTGKITFDIANKFLQTIRYDYFHTEIDMHREIKHASTMSETDHNLLLDMNCYSDRKFCTTAPFLSGCIRIERHNK